MFTVVQDKKFQEEFRLSLKNSRPELYFLVVVLESTGLVVDGGFYGRNVSLNMYYKGNSVFSLNFDSDQNRLSYGTVSNGTIAVQPNHGPTHAKTEDDLKPGGHFYHFYQEGKKHLVVASYAKIKDGEEKIRLTYVDDKGTPDDYTDDDFNNNEWFSLSELGITPDSDGNWLIRTWLERIDRDPLSRSRFPAVTGPFNT